MWMMIITTTTTLLLLLLLNRKLDGFQRWSGRFGEERNALTISSFEPRIFKPVA
jgi:hypothetical protein